MREVRRRVGAARREAGEVPAVLGITREENTSMSEIVSVLRARIIRPLDPVTWDELGSRLRELRSIEHRAANAGVVAARLHEEAQKDHRPPRTTVIGHAIKACLAE